MAHEKPPDGAQPVFGAMARPFDTAEPQENEDIILHVSPSPQEGHESTSSPSELNIKCSNVFPQLLHLNSYMGILILLGDFF